MKKGDIELDYLAKIIIAIAFLLLMAFLIWIFKDKLFEFSDKLKEIFKFGG